MDQEFLVGFSQCPNNIVFAPRLRSDAAYLLNMTFFPSQELSRIAYPNAEVNCFAFMTI